MKKAAHGKKITIHYTGKFSDGNVFDSSEHSAPIQFTLGDKKIIPALQDALIGMAPGEEKTALIPAKDAYGVRRNDMIFKIKKEALPTDIVLKPGQFLEIRHSGGEKGIARVVEIDDTCVTLDVNHPLAGKDLTFDVRVIDID